MKSDKDTHHRSILKALSWRLWATITTTIIVFVLTGKIALALGAAGIEVITKLILYYFHERIWSCVGVGKNKHPLSSLNIKEPLGEQDIKIIKNKLKSLGYISEE